MIPGVSFSIRGVFSALVLAASLQVVATPVMAESFKTGMEQRVHDWISARMIAEQNVPIPMRDGLELAANVYRPNKEGRFPVIMAFTSFNKDINWATFPFGAPPGFEPFSPTNTQGADLYTATTFEANEPVTASLALYQGGALIR